LDAATKSFLLELNTNPLYRGLVKEVKSHAPVIPRYDMSNEEEMKFTSAQLDGFELCLHLFGVKND